MFKDRISDYIEGVAAKFLTAVDADPGKSNQHEIGGLPAVGFKQFLGSPGKNEKYFFKARMIYISDTDEGLDSCADEVTWYDVRHENRSPEYRLYYKSNPVTDMLSEGDFFLIAKMRDGSLLLVFCPADSAIEIQLRAIFGLQHVAETFSAGSVGRDGLALPVRLLLEDLGLVASEALEGGASWLDRLIERFGGVQFPATKEFSSFARESIGSDCDPASAPDTALMAWMDHEEFLFRIYERHLVQDRLRKGFGEAGDDVDAFIGYSLSVQNRRKSRVGHAFEGHLETLFQKNDLKFERAKGKNRVTENNAKPDFIFPSFASYHDKDFPAERLIMLGAKTTCKDRWRQVLSEANRVSRKHLVTIEPAISSAQTDEMLSSHLQLVVPLTIQDTFTPSQRSRLIDLAGFISEVKAKAG